MKKIKEDIEYNLLIEDILKNNKFNNLKNIEHHGISRYEHSCKISFYSYKIAKKLKLNYIETARAGLLHDFFISDDNRSKLDKIKSTFNHTKIAAENSVEEFQISGKEYDIIISHMFPFCVYMPKHPESWLVNLVDKVIGTFEFGKKYSRHIQTNLVYATNVVVFILFKKL